MGFNIDTRGHKKAKKRQNIAVGPEDPPPLILIIWENKIFVYDIISTYGYFLHLRIFRPKNVQHWKWAFFLTTPKASLGMQEKKTDIFEIGQILMKFLISGSLLLETEKVLPTKILKSNFKYK